MGEVNFEVSKLGKCTIPSPKAYSTTTGNSIANYTRDDEYVLLSRQVSLSCPEQGAPSYDSASMLEVAGPRQFIYYEPSHVRAAIVTCGGLCPGLNDVIRAIVRTLWYFYGVRRIDGIPFGYRGFLPEFHYEPISLDPDKVDDIHKLGGSVLGSSRGYGERVEEITDSLERMNINVMFIIGGDGTQRGTLDIVREVARRGLKISCVGIPKTIDNDIIFVDKTFGFDTAVGKAVEAVGAAHIEAKSAMAGIGLVKVMGRDSGFIAAHTTLSTSDVNFCLIPEIPFELEGADGLLKGLERRLEQRGHAVILVAEGAGQELIRSVRAKRGSAAAGSSTVELQDRDESGNIVYDDIGFFLKTEIGRYFTDIGREVNLKYVDPGYIIRAAVASPADSHYCARLASNAVHAAMSGRTACLISQWNNALVHLPVETVVKGRKKLNPESPLWRDVLESTRQPISMSKAIS